jgi:hypothetical protein
VIWIAATFHRRRLPGEPMRGPSPRAILAEFPGFLGLSAR